MADSEQVVKVVLLGDSGVGKSSLVLRFVTNEFKPYTESTIGACFMSKTIHIDRNDEKIVQQLNRTRPTEPRTVSFRIWDTAGQEKYRSLAPMYYRGAEAAILVYDICSRASFSVLTHWVDELRRQGPPDIVLAVCGNKRDLRHHRQVDEGAAKAYADGVGAFYMETSARDNTNVKEVFREIGIRVPRVAGSDLSEIEGGQVDLGYLEESRGSSSCC